MEKESRGDETEDGEEILAVQLKAEKSRQSYADFLRKFSVLREELHADLDEFDLNYYIYGLRLYSLSRWRAGRSKKSRSLSLWSIRVIQPAENSSTIF